MSGSTIIAGAGDLGTRVAVRLCNAAHDVISLSRSGRPMPGSIRSMAADLNTGEGFTKLPQEAEALVFCVAPDERTELAYRRLYVDGLQRLLMRCRFKRLLFVGSTAVYAQDGGEWVNEDSPALSENFNAKVLRESESLCDRQAEASVLRLSGIYGPGRNRLMRRALAGEAGLAHWTNRIHAEDAAHAIVHVLGLPSAQKLYCVSDDCPALESEVLAWMRAPEAETQTGARDIAAHASGRRVRNDLLRASGWVPRYPDYRSGYRQLLPSAGV